MTPLNSIAPGEVDSIRIGRALRDSANEAALIAADRHNERLKQSGELERRRIERAGLSAFERQVNKEFGQ